MAEVELLFVAFGLVMMVLLLLILISAFIGQEAGVRIKERKYRVVFENGKYVLTKIKKPKYLH
jgi:Na+-transporting methylmalonyl-CoA/oxaloacetate decarboxylase gamma subunit